MQSTARILALLLALGTPAADAFAWGPEGHRMVGEIATRYLSAEASRQVAALLKGDRLADGHLSHRKTLDEVASWADEIKDYSWGKKRGAWHFDDLPVCGSADYSRYCRKGACASAQLARQIEILGNRELPIHRRNEALKWVVHLMGDIHQPLHAADRHDRGGNRVEVSFFGQRDNPPYGELNLHAVWDIHMVQRLVAERGGEKAVVSARIDDADKSAWERGSVSDWVNESNLIARNFVYPALPVRFSCSGRITDVLTLDQAYYSKAAPVIETQIRKAGIRLARVLNETLGR
ncbi:MAG: S1/P1 nuclease [Burkholderiales bacterium]